MRVLIVEDEVKLARAIKRALELEGYAAEAVHTAEDALFWATEQTFDAIVLDVMLPDSDGYRVCSRLRELGVRTPVLMLTARGAVEDRIAGLDAGADDYLLKPFAVGELYARLRALIRRGPAERSPLITVGDLVVDPAAHAVTRAGRRVELTAREFALVHYLAARSGQVVSRQELLDHVWDVNYDGLSNVVDVYVGYLRKKLEKPFGSTLFRAVRGVGYVMEQRG